METDKREQVYCDWCAFNRAEYILLTPAQFTGRTPQQNLLTVEGVIIVCKQDLEAYTATRLEIAPAVLIFWMVSAEDYFEQEDWSVT